MTMRSNNNNNNNNHPKNNNNERKAIITKESSHRQQVAQIIHSIWSENASDVSGLALPFFDGRVDALGWYVTLSDFDLEEENEKFHHDDDSSSSEEEKKENIQCNHRSMTTSTTIPKINASELTYQDFFQTYMEPNQPVIIKGLTQDWKAMTDWVTDPNEFNAHKQPNMEELNRLFGTEIAPVHIQTKGGFTMARPTTQEMTVSDYVSWWNDHQLQRLIQELESAEQQQQQSKSQSDQDLYYLKDWKFTRELRLRRSAPWNFFLFFFKCVINRHEKFAHRKVCSLNNIIFKILFTEGTYAT